MVNASLYMHESDKVALKALKAIPGFTPALKAFMSIWNERQFRIENMSSKLRLSEKQMSKYYNMLPPICEKLGIEIPELYLELDVNANSYTSGETKPFIVMTSGLLETLPDELIPTVLAHECGHIACHHVLYSTMGRMILNGVVMASGGFSSLITTPLKMAFAYWMRCSEFSADRVAALCDETPDKMVEVCMRFAGYDKDILADVSLDEFMAQALEYKDMIAGNKWDKTMEFLSYSMIDHPLMAVRAYDCNEWGHSDLYCKILRYMKGYAVDDLNVAKDLPMMENSKYYIGKNCNDVVEMLKKYGFKNISRNKTMERGLMTKNGQVVTIKIGEDEEFSKGDWYSDNTEISIVFYEPETPEEAALAHEGKIQVPDASKKYQGRNYQEVVTELKDAGFTNIITEARVVKKNWLNHTDSISKITISGQNQFNKGEWFDPESIIRITYQEIS